MSNRQAAETRVEVDGRALLGVVLHGLPYILVFVVIVAAGTFVLLSRLAPVYSATATVLVAPVESDLAGPAVAAAEPVDAEAVGSQVQLLRSRDIAERVARKLDLAAYPEFDPERPPSALGQMLAAIGLGSPAVDATSEERVLNAYYDHLSVTAVDNSRAIAIGFSSEVPDLAASAATAIAGEYIAMLSAARRDAVADTVDRLAGQIATLRAQVQEGETKVERYRSEHDLFAGGGGQPSATLAQQQLADLNAELTRVRSVRAEAEAKAAQARAILAGGGAPNLPDVLNAPLIQRLVEQRVTLRGRIAELNATLPPDPSRLRELNAEVAELDRQIAGEAGKILKSLESEASLAAAREAAIAAGLVTMKTEAAEAGDAGVELRALEREVAAERGLLESYLGRYREALARQQAGFTLADARVVSRATVPVEPVWPNKLALTLAATAAAFVLAVLFVLLRELASGRPVRRLAPGLRPLPAVAGGRSEADRSRWVDDRGVRRMMATEPTLVPEMVNRVEDSLTVIAGDIVKSGKKRVLVTLAEGSDEDGRPLGAVALARALARTDARVVLVDFRTDGANPVSMGEGADLPGFSDLFDGDASFAQVIFRDRKSRVHFIPAGRKPLSAGLDRAHLETVLSALTLTYDYVLFDAADDMIDVVASSSGAAMVVSEFGASDPRTVRAFERVAAVARVLLLVVDPASGSRREAGSRQTARAPAGEAA